MNADYQHLIEELNLELIKKILIKVAKNGLKELQHFYISFLTNHPKLVLSYKMRDRYPEEMTIILQNQFEDLKINDSDFSVTLSFDKIPETIVIPFSSLTNFTDPSANFAIAFSPHLYSKDAFFDKNAASQHISDPVNEIIENDIPENVIILDKFRNHSKFDK